MCLWRVGHLGVDQGRYAGKFSIMILRVKGLNREIGNDHVAWRTAIK